MRVPLTVTPNDAAPVVVLKLFDSWAVQPASTNMFVPDHVAVETFSIIMVPEADGQARCTVLVVPAPVLSMAAVPVKLQLPYTLCTMSAPAPPAVNVPAVILKLPCVFQLISLLAPDVAMFPPLIVKLPFTFTFSIVVLAIELAAPADIVALPLIVKLQVVPAPPRLSVPPLKSTLPCTMIVNVLPAPDIDTVPPVPKVSVDAVVAAVPMVHVADAGSVIECTIVHVSPGVVKLDGETLPSVQLVNVFTGPAASVVHAVANDR